MQQIINDEILGEVIFRKHSKAKRYTIRLCHKKVSVSLPSNGSYKYALKFLLKHKESLILKIKELEAQQDIKPILFDENVLKQQALGFLPQKLNNLAHEHGFTYSKIKITKSKTRWGSCSSKRSINLSLFLMILPTHLIEYVILHELCHTIHMNHGPEFWLLLNSFTNNNAKGLKKELKNYPLT